MSAVIDAVSDVVGGVFDAVGDAVESVGDVVTTVVDTVADVAQSVISDPLPTLLAIGGQMVGIPYPVTMATITAARGGDLEDIALSAGTAYLAPLAGNALSSTLSQSFIDAGMNETLSKVASNSISRGLVNGTISEVKGGSFDDGFAGAFVGGMVSGGVGEVASYVKDDVIQLAQDSGLDLRDATSVYNAGTKALSAGITSGITGQNDFLTSFTNSAISSTVDLGVRSLNASIDEQFKIAATDWDEKDKGSQPIDTTTVGAGIPSDLVTEVDISDIGYDTQPVEDTTGVAQSLDDLSEVEQPLAEAPTAFDFAAFPEAEPVTNFYDLSAAPEAEPDDVEYSTQEEELSPLASASNVMPTMPSDATMPIASAAPVVDETQTAGLAPEAPVGGLNAIAAKTSEQKMAGAQGIKSADIVKPLVASVGNLLKSSLTRPNRPAPRAVMPRPTGGLQPAKMLPTVGSGTAPRQMDISKLIPIQKTAAPPPKTLASTANLSPVSNIAGLTSLVKKAG